MKKIILIILMLVLLGGCSKNKNNLNIKSFVEKIENAKTYELNGNMELKNDEETFTYSVNVEYLKDKYYLVEMINSDNNHRQLILKNDEGLYLITPSLNKSFKFESTWPDNSSQIYILSSIIKDIKNDENASIIEDKDMIVIKSKVKYPNNPELTYQKVYFDNNKILKKIEVYSDSDLVKIELNINNLSYKTDLKKEYFNINNYTKDLEENEEDNKTKNTISQIENAIYPLYMPSNTYLSASDIINTEDDNRVILTFSGDKSFVLVEEPSVISEEHEVIPVYGEPLLLNDTIAALSSNSIYWTSDNIDYYILSDNLSISEMVFIASSLGNSQATIATK